MLPPGPRFMLQATLFFSIMNLTVKLLPHIPAVELIVFRSVITAIITWWQLRQRGISPWGQKKSFLILRGIFGSIGLFAYFYSLQTMPLAAAVTLQYLAPIFAVILGWVLLREGLRPMGWVLLFLGFVGVSLLRWYDTRIPNDALIIALIGAAAGGFAYHMIRMLRQYDDALVVVFYFPLVTLPIAVPIAAPVWVWPAGGWEWALVIAMGILTQLAQVNMTRAYQTDTAGNVSALAYSGALLGLLFGWVFWGETFHYLSLLGIALVLTSVLGQVFFQRKKTVS